MEGSAETDETGNFQKKFEEAITSEEPLVQKRGEAEERFADYQKDQKHKKFKKVAEIALNKPESITILRGPLKNAQFIIKNFEAYKRLPEGEDSLDGSQQEVVPTVTFGDIMVPVRFTNNHDPLDTDSFNRKYILLRDSSPVEKVWELLTRTWCCPIPKVVLSFTSGSTDAFMKDKDIADNFRTNLYKFCKSTGVWILSDGLHSGVSRFLGRTFQSDLEPTVKSEEEDLGKDVTLVGICDWRKLEDTTLLHGISLEKDYSSYYFYPKELDLEACEDEHMLNPFQHVYLLVQKKAGDNQLELPNEFQRYLKAADMGLVRKSLLHSPTIDKGEDGHEEMPMLEMAEDAQENMLGILLGKKAQKESIIPVVTFVLAGNEDTLHQVRASVKSKIPVVVVQGSGPIPDCLAQIYKKLESIVPRSCNHTPDLKEEEENELVSLLEQDDYRFLFKDVDEDGKKTVISNMKMIMRYRYYLNILDLSTERSADFMNVIRSIYKPYKRDDCMKIAIQTNSLSFLKAIFSREVDPEYERESGFVDEKALCALHKTNFKKHEKLFDVNSQTCTKEQILPQVGKLIFSLAGYKYSLLYQDSHLDNKLSHNPREQFWHLFLYAVLANKPEFAEYFLSLTRCPLGAALFAHKLLIGMSKLAARAMENEQAVAFKTSAEHFEGLAVKLLENMYQRNPKEAYISLTREVPFSLGPFITPLSLAADAEALSFIKTACCQTYLQRIWVKNMRMGRVVRTMLPVLSVLPLAFIPMIFFGIHFEETKTPEQYVEIEDKMSEMTEETPMTNDKDNVAFIDKLTCCQPRGCWWKLKSFYTAPITKYNMSMISYMVFLGVMSYFFLSKLEPVSCAKEVWAVEWLCYAWALGFLVEEISQVVQIQDRGPLHDLNGGKIDTKVWPFLSRMSFHMRLYRPILYLKDGSWNSMDLLMILFFAITTALRFTLPPEKFQLVRILYSIAIIAFFFRIMRYFFVLKRIGPRIIAIQMMLIELLMFMLILGVFIISFGVAFQGLLNPLQKPSMKVVADILWRPYWPLFGEFSVDESDAEGMGRDVGNSSCLKAQGDGQGDLICYSYIPTILLAIYLFISNILLLNLLIAIFGNTLNRVEDSSETHWAFNQFGMVHEYYYKLWLPSPLNILWYIGMAVFILLRHIFTLFTDPKGCWKCIKGCCSNKKSADAGDFPKDHFRMNSVLKDKYQKQVDPAQKKSYQALQRQNAIQV